MAFELGISEIDYLKLFIFEGTIRMINSNYFKIHNTRHS